MPALPASSIPRRSLSSSGGWAYSTPLADALFDRAYTRLRGWDSRTPASDYGNAHQDAFKDIVSKIHAKELELKKELEDLNHEEGRLLLACRKAYEHETVLDGLLAIVKAVDQTYDHKLNLVDIETMLTGRKDHWASEYSKEKHAFDALKNQAAGASHAAPSSGGAPASAVPSSSPPPGSPTAGGATAASSEESGSSYAFNFSRSRPSFEASAGWCDPHKKLSSARDRSSVGGHGEYISTPPVRAIRRF